MDDSCFLCSGTMARTEATAYVAAAGLRVHRDCLRRELAEEFPTPPPWSESWGVVRG